MKTQGPNFSAFSEIDLASRLVQPYGDLDDKCMTDLLYPLSNSESTGICQRISDQNVYVGAIQTQIESDSEFLVGTRHIIIATSRVGIASLMKGLRYR